MQPQVNHPVSSTSVEAGLNKLVPQENATPPNDPTVKPTVRINKNPTSNPPSITQAVSATKQVSGSILWHAPATPLAEISTPPTINELQSTEPARRTIIDGQCKLLIAIDNDGHEKMFSWRTFLACILHGQS
jgi:hypothetical protein